MANKFNIIITATDRGTAVVRKFKDQISQITRPVRQTMQSFSKFGKELGLDKLAKGFSKIAKTAVGGSLDIMGFGAAAEAMGLGIVAAGIAVVAGALALARYTYGWATLGSEVRRTAAIIGIGIPQLQVLRGTAKAAGLEATDMDAALKGVGETLQGALFGRNQAALVMMNRLHIGLHRLKDGSVDTERALLDVSSAITRQHGAEQQRLIASAFGMEGILPLLQRGPAYIANLQRQVRATNSIMGTVDTKKYAEFQTNVSLLQQSIDGLGLSLANKLLPVLSPAVTGLTHLIELSGRAYTSSFSVNTDPNDKASRTAGSSKDRGDSGPRMVGFRGMAVDALVYLIRKLEGSRDDAVSRPAFAGSRGGAIGRFQIMPATARAYGFDPSQLTNPGYSEKVARAILGDLAKRYHGNLDDILIGYNSTPKYVERFNRSGGDLNSLLPETRRYLEKAHGNSSLMRLITAGAARGGATGAEAVRVTGKSGPAEVVVRFQNTPPGTQVSSKGNSGVSVSPKVNYSLPDLATP